MTNFGPVQSRSVSHGLNHTYNHRIFLGNIARVNTTEWAEKNDWDPVLLFDKFFNEDIGQLLKMSKLWEKDGRKKPTPLVYKDIVSILPRFEI